MNREFADAETQRKAIKAAIMEKYDSFESVYRECIADPYKRADADLKAKIDATESEIKSRCEEMLLGYFIGPFGALLSSGIFTSILQNYFTDVLKLDLGFLTTLQLVSTVLIVASNLIVGQLIEHTKALAGKARPWILLSALTLSVASVLMFIVPFEGMAKMVWIAIAYNLYYAVAYPIYQHRQLHHDPRFHP